MSFDIEKALEEAGIPVTVYEPYQKARARLVRDEFAKRIPSIRARLHIMRVEASYPIIRSLATKHHEQVVFDREALPKNKQ